MAGTMKNLGETGETGKGGGFGISKKNELKEKERSLQKRIVGGSDASENEYPFFVSWGGCGASLIHEDIVLTAAHCNGIEDNELIISAYRSGSSQGGAESRQIARRVPHPQYNDNTVEYDYMIFKLTSSSGKQPIAINRKKNQPEDSEQLTVIGFGLTSDGGDDTPEILQEVIVPTVSFDVCNGQYGRSLNEAVMFCAGYAEGGRDSCQGDSGGPIFEFENGTPIQVGVVSFGDGCAQPNKSGVYARVSGVQDWIDEQICALSSNPPSTCGPTPPTSPIQPPPPASPASPAPQPVSGPDENENPTPSASSPVYSPVHHSPVSSPVYSPTTTEESTGGGTWFGWWP